MGKVATLQPRVALLQSGVAIATGPTYEADRIRGRALQKIRDEYRRFEPRCVRCKEEGRTRPWMDLDHVVALVNGGRDELSNRVGLCKEHHTAKTRDDMRQARSSGWVA